MTMEFNLNKILNDVKNLKCKNIAAVYLFGSFALGKENPLSDIDICVIGNLTESEKSEIFYKFPDRVDVSFFDELPIWIRARVFRDGKKLLVNNENELNSIKLNTLKDYLDFRYLIEKRIVRRFGYV